MIFSTTTLHALRAVARLAEEPAGTALLGRDLAKSVRVPPDYLSKILSRLRRAGVLTATKGAQGGYRFARPSGQIPLKEVVHLFEGDRARSRCLLRGRDCDGEECPAHAAFSEVKGAYIHFLESTTAADLGRPKASFSLEIGATNRVASGRSGKAARRTK